MTTGRINQVTILNPARARRTERPPGGGGTFALPLQEGRRPRAATQPKAPVAQNATGPPTTDSIAPTEFPRARSAAGEIGPRGPPNSAAYAPQEEKTRPPVTPVRAVTGGGQPRRPDGKGSAWPSAHRSHESCLLTRGPAGLRFPTPSAGAGPGGTAWLWALARQSEWSRGYPAPGRRADQSERGLPLPGKRGVLVRYQAAGAAEGGPKPAASSGRTRAAQGMVRCRRLFKRLISIAGRRPGGEVDLTRPAPPYILWNLVLVRLSRFPVDLSEKVFSATILYEKSSRHAQAHTKDREAKTEIANKLLDGFRLLLVGRGGGEGSPLAGGGGVLAHPPPPKKRKKKG